MVVRRIEILLEDKLASDFIAKLREESFIKSNGKPAFSAAIKHLIRNFIYD